MGKPNVNLGNNKWSTKSGGILGYEDNINKNVSPVEFDFSRASSGTTVNRQGLIELVDEGVELLSDGDFLSTGTQAASTSGVYWTTGIGWKIEGGSAVCNGTQSGGSSLSSIIMTVTPNSVLKVTIQVDETSVGFRLYDSLGVVDYSLDVGERVFMRTPTTSSYSITPIALAGSIGSISSISVEEVLEEYPRIDFSEYTEGALLLEPQSTNIISHSENFSDSSWFKQANISIVSSNNISPSGVQDATLLTGNGSDGIYSIVTASGLVTRSIYLKSVTGTISLLIKDPSKTITSKSISVTTTWQRFDLIEDNTHATNSGIWVSNIPSSGVYIWGAQLEALPYATSYIPNYGNASGVTRAADTCNNGGLLGNFNDEEGVLYAEIKLPTTSGFRLIGISDGTSNNRIYLGGGSGENTLIAAVQVNGVYSANLNVAYNVLEFNKIALKYKLNDMSLWINGVEMALSSTGVVFPSGTLTTLQFDSGAGSSTFKGKVKDLRVYRTALTDDELVLLTRPSYSSYESMSNSLEYKVI